MGKQQLFPYVIGLPCDGFMCIQPTRWAVGAIGATAATYHKLCDADARYLARTLPPELLAEALAAAPTGALAEALAPRLAPALARAVLEAAGVAQPVALEGATDPATGPLAVAPSTAAGTIARCACGKPFDLSRGFGRKNFERHQAACPIAQAGRDVA